MLKSKGPFGLPRRAISTARFNSLMLVLLALVSTAGTLAGCRNSEKHYELRGRVLTKSGDQITVDHEAIPGLMPAMTMPYPVKDPAALEQVQPGDTITAELVVDKNKNDWLDHIVVADTSGRGAISITTSDDLQPGDHIPDLPLVNQDGRTIHLSAFKGSAVLVTFIYTRCPFPTFCPLLTSEFASIHRELLKTPGDYKKTHLVSISLDPEYDTPSVMRKYGLSYLNNDPAGFEHWDFVSTTPADLKKLAGAFGLVYFEQDNQITHSLLTVLLAADGTVAKAWAGNEWRKPEIVDAVRQAAAGQ